MPPFDLASVLTHNDRLGSGSVLQEVCRMEHSPAAIATFPAIAR